MNTKKLKFFTRISLVLIFLISSVMAVKTAAQEASRVVAVLSTDKESYVSGETAALQLKITNGYDYKLDNVAVEISLPEEMELQSGNLIENGFALEAGESKTNNISLSIQGEPEEPTTEETTEEETTEEETTEEETTEEETTEEETTEEETTEEETTEEETTEEETTEEATSEGKPEGPSPDNPGAGESGLKFWIVLTALSGMAVLAILFKGKNKKQIMSLFLCLAILMTTIPVPVSAADLVTPSDSVMVEKKVTINGNERTIKATVTYDGKTESEDNTVTITFQSFEGTPVDAITIEKGEAPGRLPQSYQTGKAFVGWYSDPELEEEFFSDTILTEDVTLYASFIDVEDNVKIANKQTYYISDCDASMPITLICDEEITSENLNLYMTLYAFTGETPDKFTVTKSGNNEYTIVPETPYSAGCHYRMTIPEDVKFKGLEETVNEYSFRIHKEECEIVEFDDGVKYVNREKFAKTDTEYKFMVSKEYVEEKGLAVDDTMCIGDGTDNYNVDVLFYNIIDMEEQNDCYLISCEDSRIEDVFDKVDIYFEDTTIQNKYLTEGFDAEAFADEVYNSEGTRQLVRLMAAVLAESPAVMEELDGKTLLGSDITMKDFSDTAYLDEDREFLELETELMEMLTITVKIGYAVNENFYNPNDDYWTVLTFEFGWEGTLKNMLKIDATFTISEYMNVSLQGYKKINLELFELPDVEFDYAVNIYSQTDLGLKVLICSTSAANETDDYIDISENVSEMLESDEENDTDNLVSQVKEMLEKQGDAIEICNVPFVAAQIPIAIISFNFELSFIVRVNFAAGLSSKLSVLESRQIGVHANTETKEFGMYNNDLGEGDRYSFDFTMCGYMGIEMGVRGELSVSVVNFSEFGKIGIAIELGVYLDLYGYVRYHVVKPYSEYNTVYSTVFGGLYIESGIYLKLSLFAKSDIFKAKAEASLFDKKWPLFSVGKKDLLITLNDLNTPIMMPTNGGRTGSLNLSDAPALTGRVLDITTGEIKENAIIPWSSVVLRFSNECFKDRIEYRKLWSSDNDSSAESMIDIYYIGQTLQFTKKAANGERTAVKGKVIWYDKDRVEEADIGKIYTVKFYLDCEGDKKLLGTREVMAGNYLGYCSYSELNNPEYTDGKWDKDPLTTVINENMDFVYSCKRTQARVIFTYFDNETKQWKAEMKVANVGDIPSLDSKYENEHMKISGWEEISGGGLDYSNNYVIDADGQKVNYQYQYRGLGKGFRRHYSEMVAMYERITDKAILTGRPTDEILFSAAGESANEAIYNLEKQCEDDCKLVAYVYIPSYSRDNVKVTYTNLDGDGNTITDTAEVAYGTPFSIQKVFSPYWMDFKGYSSDGGKTLYTWRSEFPNLYEDTLYEAIYEPIMHNVTLQYYDNETNEFKEYKTIQIRRGLTVPQEYFDEAENAYVWPEGVTYNIFGWIDIVNGSSVTDPIWGDTTMRLSFRRSVRIDLDAGDGEYLFDEHFTQSFDTDNYKVKIGNRAAKASDEYYDYPLTGWKNEETGEIYGVNEEVTIFKPVTLKAVYTAVPKTYNVKITMLYGTFENGTNELNFTDVDYDTYNSIISEYSEWTPDDYRDDENHCTYKYIGCTSGTSGNTYTIEYNYWNKVVDKHTITIDVNGGIYEGSTTLVKEWNTEIDLSEIIATKEDDYAVWKMRDWTDASGNVYSVGGKYTVSGNDTLTINWEVDTYKEYTVTFELDGVEIDSKTYHKNDVLESFGKPTEADGKVFSGWTWYNSNGEEITACTKMPAENLTLKGTTSNVYIKYVVDGQEMTEYEKTGKVGYEEAVRAAYEKVGYTVNPWTTTDVTVDENGKFIMPEHNVTFTTTTSKNSYKVTYYHNDTIYGEEETIAFGDYVLLIDVPKEEGAYYAWTSEDAMLTDVGFTMPAHDVIIRSSASETKQYIIYHVNDEIIGYDTAIPGQTVFVRGTPMVDKYLDMDFSGWYVGNTLLTNYDGPSMIDVGNEPIHIYGYFTKGTTAVKIYFYENIPVPTLVLYGNVGDKINITMLMNDQELAGYEVNGEVVNEISITDTNTIDAYVQYTDKTYTVRYNGDGFDLPAANRYKANARVELPDLPADTASVSVKGWFLADADIEQDTNGKLYFIMPEHDVVVNLKSQDTSSQSGKTASVYINSPYSKDPMFFMDYDINNNDTPVCFDVPQIEGYEFIGWKDENGNIVASDNQGIILDDMNGVNRNFYGEYRKVELHIIEFRVDDNVVGYQKFYDTYAVEVTNPTVVVGEGETFSGWSNEFVNPIIVGNKVLFYTGERKTYEYTKKDFIFNGYIQ